jgi:hypothetical protein
MNHLQNTVRAKTPDCVKGHTKGCMLFDINALNANHLPEHLIVRKATPKTLILFDINVLYTKHPHRHLIVSKATPKAPDEPFPGGCVDLNI